MEKKSFLQARDPSLQFYTVQQLRSLRTNMQDLFEQAEDTFRSSLASLPETVEEEAEEERHISVFLRIKPTGSVEKLYKVEDNTLVVKVPWQKRARDNVLNKFMFSHILGPQAQQANIFNVLVKRKILEFINGTNATLMTYGASGSGKTYTIVGTRSDPGLIPRSLEYMFRTLPKMKGPRVKPLPNGRIQLLGSAEQREERRRLQAMLNSSQMGSEREAHVEVYTDMQRRLTVQLLPPAECDERRNVIVDIWISYAEIYNEQIYDLLVPPPPPRGKPRVQLKIGTCDGGAYIKELSQVSVTSGLEAFQVMQYGLHHLHSAATGINANSSRSHAIFTISLVQAAGVNQELVQTSTFTFCDLAGAERLKKTGNVGDRLQESKSINMSLMTLSRCIELVRKSQKSGLGGTATIPFRDSKLTMLLQQALSGKENTSMIVNINPCRDMHEETVHVLNFSALVKDVVVAPPKRRGGRFSMHVNGRSTEIGAGDAAAAAAAPNDRNGNGAAGGDIDTVEGLRRIIDEMHENCEAQRLQREAEHQEDIQELHDGYYNMIQETNRMHEASMRRVLETHRKRLEEQKQSLLEEIRDKQQDIVYIINDDDDDDDDNDDKGHKRDDGELQQELEAARAEIVELKCTRERDRALIEEQRLTIADGVEEFRAMEQELQQLKREKILLEQELDTLHVAYRNSMVAALSSSASSSSDDEEDEEEVEKQVEQVER